MRLHTGTNEIDGRVWRGDLADPSSSVSTGADRAAAIMIATAF